MKELKKFIENFFIKVWWDPILTKKGYTFQEKEASLGEICLFYHSRRLTKNIK